MRPIFFLILLLPAFCFGQKDPCKKVSRSIDNGVVTYKSPDVSRYVSVIKQFKSTEIFVLRLNISDVNEHYEKTGIAVELADGTVFREDNAAVDCQQETSTLNAGFSASTAASSGRYLLQGFFHITDDNIEKLSTKPISRISLHNAFQKIPEKEGIRLMRYIRCISERKE